MKKNLISALIGGAALFAIGQSALAAPLTNWTYDPDGAAGSASARLVSYEMSGSSNGLIQFAPTSSTTFAWQEWGFVNFTGPQGGGNLGFCDPDTGCSGNEFTGIYHLQGTGTFGGAALVSSGTMSLFAEKLSLTTQYGTTAGFYGANNGTNIMSVNVTGGSINPVANAAIPVPTSNAQLVVSGNPTSIATGVFGAGPWGDMSSHLANGGMVMGFVTGNASSNINPPADLAPELIQYACSSAANPLLCASGFIFEGERANAFIVSSGAQLKFDVPEPASLALLGLSLFGLGVSRRRKAN